MLPLHFHCQAIAKANAQYAHLALAIQEANAFSDAQVQICKPTAAYHQQQQHPPRS
jgi:hypothetical protein